MRSLPPPRSDVIAFGVTLTTLILVISYQCGWISTTHIQLTGLGIDILGAVILVIPDVPLLEGWFQSGKLKTALERLRSGWFPLLTAREQVAEAPEDRKHLFSEEGFIETRDVFKEWEEEREKDVKVWDRVYQFVPTELDPSKRGETIFIDVWIDPDEPHHSIQKHDLPLHVERKIEQLEARFRRSGILLLIFGFIVQAGSVIAG